MVKSTLTGHSKCSGHCEELSKLKVLYQKGMMLGCYTCPSGYVSRIIAYGKELNLTAFKSLISSFAKGVADVDDQDIRVATRYTWDLGIQGTNPGMVLREAYWTQSYRRTKNEDPNRVALFMCTRCSSFYNQALSESNKLCPRCRGISP